MFTLNQDVLLERFGSQDRGICQIPALSNPDWFTGRLVDQSFPETDISSPPKFDFFRKNFWAKDTGLSNFLYIKIHGSYRWKSSQDGNALVIGYDKAGSIAEEPLLNWYLELFNEVLKTQNIKLVVVGYGFMDAHINNVIADAAKTGLELHVVNPMQPNDFKDYLFFRSAGGLVLNPFHVVKKSGGCCAGITADL